MSMTWRKKERKKERRMLAINQGEGIPLEFQWFPLEVKGLPLEIKVCLLEIKEFPLETKGLV